METPVLIGVGQITERDVPPADALDPPGLVAAAARRACEDAGVRGLLERVDSCRAVNALSWRAGNFAGAIVERLGISPAERVETTIGGNGPQMLVNATADDVAAGRTRMALLGGAEAVATLKRARRESVPLEWKAPAGEPTTTLGDDRWGVTEIEAAHGAALPIAVYPLFENALRRHRGWSLDEHRRAIGKLFAPFTEVAATNPYAWFPERRSAEELVAVSDSNRMVGFPYTKLVNSIIDVNQGAAILMTSAREADALGVPADRRIYPLAGAEACDHFFVSDRPTFDVSLAIRAMAAALFEAAEIGVDDLSFIDLYSCFPVAVELARDAIGIDLDDPRPLTVTGGLPYFGGPGNDYTMHAIATLAQKLRAEPEAIGLATGLGWFLTKHAMGLYSATPQRPWTHCDGAAIQAEVDAVASPPTAAAPSGTATVETYTVLHGRDGAPERGIVVGRTGNGERFFANTPSERDVLEAMEREDPLDAPGRVTPGDPTNLFTFS